MLTLGMVNDKKEKTWQTYTGTLHIQNLSCNQH